MPGPPSLILASASPRRRDLLAGLGVRFTVRPVDVDETPRTGEEPLAYVLRLAEEKALERVGEGELVLAADTTVVLDGEILGKPADEAEAREMLGRIAGREHTVLTGVALAEPGAEAGGGSAVRSVAEETRVRMAPMSGDEMAWYAATGETLDKAGSYAVQGIGALFVEAVFGDYTNVVGLPLPATYRLFREAGHDLRELRE
ncbi:MAG TPA: Maf family protein [Thermoanaerobaculia bacterium]|nr:Maf family protein [Thermoanaerobaculia bacterium]